MSENFQHNNSSDSHYSQYEQQYPQPRPSVTLKQALHNNRKYLWHFSGRASRTEFWKAWGFWSAITLIPLFLGYIGWIIILVSYKPEADSGFPAGIMIYFLIYAFLVMILGLVNILLTLSLGWRRLQDARFPGALWILIFIGVGIVPLIMCMLPSSPNGLSYDGPKDHNRP